jgi:hypothetical protein
MRGSGELSGPQAWLLVCADRKSKPEEATISSSASSLVQTRPDLPGSPASAEGEKSVGTETLPVVAMFSLRVFSIRPGSRMGGRQSCAGVLQHTGCLRLPAMSAHSLASAWSAPSRRLSAPGVRPGGRSSAPLHIVAPTLSWPRQYILIQRGICQKVAEHRSPLSQPSRIRGQRAVEVKIRTRGKTTR